MICMGVVVVYVLSRIGTAEKEVVIGVDEMSGNRIEGGAGNNTSARKIKVVGGIVECFDVVTARLSP